MLSVQISKFTLPHKGIAPTKHFFLFMRFAFNLTLLILTEIQYENIYTLFAFLQNLSDIELLLIDMSISFFTLFVSFHRLCFFKIILPNFATDGYELKYITIFLDNKFMLISTISPTSYLHPSTPKHALEVVQPGRQNALVAWEELTFLRL